MFITRTASVAGSPVAGTVTAGCSALICSPASRLSAAVSGSGRVWPDAARCPPRTRVAAAAARVAVRAGMTVASGPLSPSSLALDLVPGQERVTVHAEVGPGRIALTAVAADVRRHRRPSSSRRESRTRHLPLWRVHLGEHVLARPAVPSSNAGSRLRTRGRAARFDTAAVLERASARPGVRRHPRQPARPVRRRPSRCWRSGRRRWSECRSLEARCPAQWVRGRRWRC